MKKIIVGLYCFGLVAGAQAANPFRCEGHNSQGERMMTLSASGQSITQLKNVRLVWLSSYQVRLSLPIVEKAEKYKPRNPQYIGHDKWVVDVANGPACRWDLILPPARNRQASFVGYSQTACDSYYETITLTCSNL